MAVTESGFAAVDDGRLYYERTGDGPAVVLLHGFAVDRRMWDDQVDVLSERHSVIAYDLRGFGRSSIPVGPYAHAKDLAVLLDHVCVEQANLIGSSMGGRVAIDFGIIFPERTLGIVSVAGMPGGFVFSRRRRSGPATRSAAQRPDESGRDTPSLRGGAPRPGPSPLQKTLGRLTPERAAWLKGIVADYSRWHRKNDDPRTEVQPPAIEQLGAIAAPVLVAVGEEDQEDFHRAAETLAIGIGRSRRLELQGCGHLPNIEDPAAFNKAVLEFLELTRK